MGFRELDKLEKLIGKGSPFLRYSVLSQVKAKDENLPVYGLVIGPENKSLPTLGLFAGVHGLEKIGTHLVINYLKSLIYQLEWDSTLQNVFEHCRLASIPIVNPAGMMLNRRSNGRGVDIMRNAPVEADADAAKLLSGHFHGPWLPWYRGQPNEEMEVETQTLYKFVKQEMFEAPLALSLDVHSGFGAVDRLWHPYSRTKKPFPFLATAKKLESLLHQSLPHNVYKIEPQSQSYLIHGDIWDYLLDEHYSTHEGKKIFLPWTLEMGSWMWVRKNPLQAFSSKGFFNPIRPHRYDRIMRRHRFLLDFLRQATLHHNNWVGQ